MGKDLGIDIFLSAECIQLVHGVHWKIDCEEALPKWHYLVSNMLDVLT